MRRTVACSTGKRWMGDWTHSGSTVWNTRCSTRESMDLRSGARDCFLLVGDGRGPDDADACVAQRSGCVLSHVRP